ncbi:MAG: hypothetical protein HC802_13090, partial [Caldilineaceae bacterium]|nr:hypothetical protein [Caldilineaceae bacterium]
MRRQTESSTPPVSEAAQADQPSGSDPSEGEPSVEASQPDVKIPDSVQREADVQPVAPPAAPPAAPVDEAPDSGQPATFARDLEADRSIQTKPATPADSIDPVGAPSGLSQADLQRQPEMVEKVEQIRSDATEERSSPTVQPDVSHSEGIAPRQESSALQRTPESNDLPRAQPELESKPARLQRDATDAVDPTAEPRSAAPDTGAATLLPAQAAAPQQESSTVQRTPDSNDLPRPQPEVDSEPSALQRNVADAVDLAPEPESVAPETELATLPPAEAAAPERESSALQRLPDTDDPLPMQSGQSDSPPLQRDATDRVSAGPGTSIQYPEADSVAQQTAELRQESTVQREAPAATVASEQEAAALQRLPDADFPVPTQPEPVNGPAAPQSGGETFEAGSMTEQTPALQREVRDQRESPAAGVAASEQERPALQRLPDVDVPLVVQRDVANDPNSAPDPGPGEIKSVAPDVQRLLEDVSDGAVSSSAVGHQVESASLQQKQDAAPMLSPNVPTVEAATADQGDPSIAVAQRFAESTGPSDDRAEPADVLPVQRMSDVDSVSTSESLSQEALGENSPFGKQSTVEQAVAPEIPAARSNAPQVDVQRVEVQEARADSTEGSDLASLQQSAASVPPSGDGQLAETTASKPNVDVQRRPDSMPEATTPVAPIDAVDSTGPEARRQVDRDVAPGLTEDVTAVQRTLQDVALPARSQEVGDAPAVKDVASDLQTRCRRANCLGIPAGPTVRWRAGGPT